MNHESGNQFRPHDEPRSPWGLNWTTREGAAVKAGAYSVTPVAQALEVRWPGGGFVWNHPAAVIIERDGKIERAPIRDETRAAQVAALAITLVAGLIATWTWSIARSKSDGR